MDYSIVQAEKVDIFFCCLIQSVCLGWIQNSDIRKLKCGWWRGSSGRAVAWQEWSPKFKPQYWQKKLICRTNFLFPFCCLYSTSNFSSANLERMRLYQKGVRKAMVISILGQFCLVPGMWYWPQWSEVLVFGLSFFHAFHSLGLKLLTTHAFGETYDNFPSI
jgi:hypothetical protein